MDFIGEIIEREVEAPSVPVQREVTGFPKRDKEKKESRWKQRQLQQRKPASLQTPKPKPEPKPMVHLSEAEKIHNENMEKISRMTEGEIEAEREELLEGLNPNLVKALLARVEKRQQKESESHSHGNDLCHDHHAEGSNTDGWIGGDRNGKLSLPSLDKKDVDLALGIGELDIDKEEDLSGSTEAAEGKFKDEDGKKKVRFDQVTSVKYEDLDDDVELDPNGWEDVDDINDLVPNTHLIQHDDEEEVAADGYQLVDENEHTHSHGPGVHFPKPKPQDNEDLDLNDPEFYDKLHEKYYPDLPKETSKLSWMTTPIPETRINTYESIGDLRFDFKGDLVELENDTDTPTYMGLHHHSENPNLAGYTLSELAHLARSVVPGQRCVAIQTLGRVLHKLGQHKYSVMPIDTEDPESKEFNEGIREISENFEKMIWDLIEQLRLLETLNEAADESKTRNLSVRNYAIEALWLWKQGEKRAEK